MTRKEIQESVYKWALSRQDYFNAPYGVLEGENTNQVGHKYMSVTFGKSRTLDVAVNIYGDAFIQVRTSKHGSQVFKSTEAMQKFLDTL